MLILRLSKLCNNYKRNFCKSGGLLFSSKYMLTNWLIAEKIQNNESFPEYLEVNKKAIVQKTSCNVLCKVLHLVCDLLYPLVILYMCACELGV